MARVFVNESFEDARARAQAEGKLLIVDGTAAWCGPCQLMDRVSWSDPAVERWIVEHAIAVQFDVDEQASLAESLSVRAMPTVIVFRDGGEVDRAVGMKKPAELLGWLDGLLRGETELIGLERTVRSEPANIDARYTFAKKLVDAGRLAEATEEFAWMWLHMLEHEPAMIGVRGSFMLGEIKSLIEAHPPARERFSRIRDDLGSVVRSGVASADQIRDWFDISQLLGEPAGLLEWYDESADLLQQRDDLENVLREKVVSLLLAKGRWADAAKLFRDPLPLLREEHDRTAQVERTPLPEGMEEFEAEFRRSIVEGFLRSAGVIHAALVAAGRDTEAHAVAEEARRLRPEADVDKALAEILAKSTATSRD